MILANHGIVSSSGGLPPSTLLNNLYAVYKAENNANDSFGTLNGTAVGGLTYTTGKIGNAFIGNSTNAHITLPRTSNEFDFTDFSISLWYKHQSDSGIFSNYYGINTSNRYGYKLYVQGGKVRFAIYKGTTATVTNIGESSSLTAGNVYNIVITKVSGGNMLIYINNNLQTLTVISGALNADPIYNSSNSVAIGVQINDGGTKSSYFSGYIDELNIWNKELTTTEITELYNSGSGKFYPY